MKRYVQTVLLMLDEFVNALFGGYAEETLSHRFALNASKGGLPGCLFCKVIGLIWPNHCNLAKAKTLTLVRPK